MRISFSYGACIYCDNVSIDNIYSIDINEESKTIELNGYNNFVEAWIRYYDEVEEVSILHYNDSGDIELGYEVPIIKNGKLVYNENNNCINCDKLYDCDNNAHEQQWLKCMENGKLR